MQRARTAPPKKIQRHVVESLVGSVLFHSDAPLLKLRTFVSTLEGRPRFLAQNYVSIQPLQSLLTQYMYVYIILNLPWCVVPTFHASLKLP